MRLGGILDRQPAEQELVGLGVVARLLDGVRHVVLLGEEPRGAQDHDRQLVQMVEQPAQLLGGALGDAVDVARLERPQRLVDPHRLRGTAGFAVADLLRDHQRGGRGEDEAVDLRARRDGLLEEVERALHVHRHELRIVVRLDVRLVARRAVHDRLDAVVAHEMARPGRGRRPSPRPRWSGRARDRDRRPCGRRARAAAPGSGRASLTNLSPGCSSRRFRRDAGQHVVHDVGGPVVGDAVAPEYPSRLVVGEPGALLVLPDQHSRAAGRWQASASPAWRACRRAGCRTPPRRWAAIPGRPSPPRRHGRCA